MKYSVHDYAKALAEASRDVGKTGQSTDAIVKQFIAILRKNGDEGMLKKIVEEAARFMRSDAEAAPSAKTVRDVLVESARPLSKSQEAIVKNFLKSGDAVRYAVNADLVAGVRITVNDEMQFDASLQHKLDTMFGTA